MMDGYLLYLSTLSIYSSCPALPCAGVLFLASLHLWVVCTYIDHGYPCHKSHTIDHTIHYYAGSVRTIAASAFMGGRTGSNGRDGR